MPIEIPIDETRRGIAGSKPRAVTLRDVSRLAGVSTATVSRALEKPDTVAEATRARIMEAVAACGYTPNMMARNLRKSRAASRQDARQIRAASMQGESGDGD